MPQPVVTCPGCKRRTPSRHPRCTYCSASLGGPDAAAIEEPRMLGGKPRFVRQSDDKTHYLVTDFHDPIAMDPGILFVMGRDPHTTLVIRASDVSRQHAEIDWDANDPPRPILREVRSSAGTFLNDKLVPRDAPQPLRSGDRIRLGASTELTYLHLTERDLRKELEERQASETRTFNPSILRAALMADAREVGPAIAPPAPTPTAPPPAAARAATPEPVSLPQAPVGESTSEAGNFAQLAPAALIKRLHDQRESGILTFFLDGAAPGEVVLIEGRCKDAIVGLYRGREAVEVLAGVDQGAYRFRREDPERLRMAPPSAEVDERGLALSGFLAGEFSGEALLQDLVGQRASGVLTVWDGEATGEVTLERGICQAAVFGFQRAREAMDALRTLDLGAYRFRPEPPAPGSDLPATQKVRPVDPARPAQRPSERVPVAGPPRPPGPGSGSGRVPVAPGAPGPRPSGVRPGPPGARPTGSGVRRALPPSSESGRVPALRPPNATPPGAPPPTAGPPRPGSGERRPPTRPNLRPTSSDSHRALPPGPPPAGPPR